MQHQDLIAPTPNLSILLPNLQLPTLRSSNSVQSKFPNRRENLRVSTRERRRSLSSRRASRDSLRDDGQLSNKREISS